MLEGGIQNTICIDKHYNCRIAGKLYFECNDLIIIIRMQLAQSQSREQQKKRNRFRDKINALNIIV